MGGETKGHPLPSSSPSLSSRCLPLAALAVAACGFPLQAFTRSSLHDSVSDPVSQCESQDPQPLWLQIPDYLTLSRELPSLSLWIPLPPFVCCLTCWLRLTQEDDNVCQSLAPRLPSLYPLLARANTLIMFSSRSITGSHTPEGVWRVIKRSKNISRSRVLQRDSLLSGTAVTRLAGGSECAGFPLTPVCLRERERENRLTSYLLRSQLDSWCVCLRELLLRGKHRDLPFSSWNSRSKQLHHHWIHSLSRCCPASAAREPDPLS